MSDLVVGSQVVLKIVDSTSGQSYVCGDKSYLTDQNITLDRTNLPATGDTGGASLYVCVRACRCVYVRIHVCFWFNTKLVQYENSLVSSSLFTILICAISQHVKPKSSTNKVYQRN